MVAGFDGYEKSDQANDQTSILLKIFKKNLKVIKLRALQKQSIIFRNISFDE